MQHRIHGERCAGRFDIREGAEHERRSGALRDAAFDEREFGQPGPGLPSYAPCGAGLGDRDEFMQEFALLPFAQVAPGDLGGRRRARIRFPQRRHAATARQHIWQRHARFAAGQVDDGAADLGVAGQGTVTFVCVPGRQARPLRKRQRHGAIACRPAPELEPLSAPPDAKHRVLPKTGDQREALIRWRQRLDGLVRDRQRAGVRLRPGGPVRRIERIEVLAGGSKGKQFAETRECRQHLASEPVRVVHEIEHRQAADQRISSAQCLDGDESAAIRRAKLDDAPDPVAIPVRERRAGNQSTHAVTDEHGILPPLAPQAFHQQAAIAGEVEAPVVGMEIRVVTRDPQYEPQPFIGKAQYAERPVTAAARQRELGHAAERDLGRIEPLEIIGQALADAPERRAHDAGQDQRTPAAAHAGGAAGEPREFLVGFEIR